MVFSRWVVNVVVIFLQSSRELCEWTKDGTETKILMMKWPSANPNDRKSVFYTSEDSVKILAAVKVS